MNRSTSLISFSARKSQRKKQDTVYCVSVPTLVRSTRDTNSPTTGYLTPGTAIEIEILDDACIQISGPVSGWIHCAEDEASVVIEMTSHEMERLRRDELLDDEDSEEIGSNYSDAGSSEAGSIDTTHGSVNCGDISFVNIQKQEGSLNSLLQPKMMKRVQYLDIRKYQYGVIEKRKKHSFFSKVKNMFKRKGKKESIHLPQRITAKELQQWSKDMVYCVCVPTMIRESRSYDSQPAGGLSPGVMVTVEEIIGYRARISSPVVGWISIIAINGIQILVQVHKDDFNFFLAQLHDKLNGVSAVIPNTDPHWFDASSWSQSTWNQPTSAYLGPRALETSIVFVPDQSDEKVRNLLIARASGPGYTIWDFDRHGVLEDYKAKSQLLLVVSGCKSVPAANGVYRPVLRNWEPVDSFVPSMEHIPMWRKNVPIWVHESQPFSLSKNGLFSCDGKILEYTSSKTRNSSIDVITFSAPPVIMEDGEWLPMHFPRLAFSTITVEYMSPIEEPYLVHFLNLVLDIHPMEASGWLGAILDDTDAKQWAHFLFLERMSMSGELIE